MLKNKMALFTTTRFRWLALRSRESAGALRVRGSADASQCAALSRRAAQRRSKQALPLRAGARHLAMTILSFFGMSSSSTPLSSSEGNCSPNLAVWHDKRRARRHDTTQQRQQAVRGRCVCARRGWRCRGGSGRSGGRHRSAASQRRAPRMPRCTEDLTRFWPLTVSATENLRRARARERGRAAEQQSGRAAALRECSAAGRTF
jgi:hypothetical protein